MNDGMLLNDTLTWDDEHLVDGGPPQFAFFSSEPSTHELEPGWLGPSIFSGAIPNGRASVLFSGKWVEDRSLCLSAAFIWNLASATGSLGRMRNVNSLYLLGKLPFESWWKSKSCFLLYQSGVMGWAGREKAWFKHYIFSQFLLVLVESLKRAVFLSGFMLLKSVALCS